MIEGYSFVRLDRNRHAGGVAIYCCDTLEFRKRDDIPISTLEMVCIEINPPRAIPYLVISWYRPPSDNVETFGKPESVLRSLESENKEFILLGDTNCDYSVILQESSVANLPNTTRQLEHLYNSFGLKQLINKPTRETTDTSSIIDHIAINIASNVIESGVLKLGLSDHYLVYAIRKFRGNMPCNHKIIKTRKMKNFYEELFLNDLAAIDWQRILICSQYINEAVQNWTNILSLVVGKHAPLIERRVSDKSTPWLNPEIKKMFRTRDKLKTATVKSRLMDILMEAYKQVHNRTNAMKSKLKKEYFTDKIRSCERNMKDTWNTINLLINKQPKTTIISSLLVDGNVVTKPEKIADSMNKYFCSIGEELSKDIPYNLNSFLSNQIHAPDRSFIFPPINAEHIIIAISKVKYSHGFGLENISSFFLKKSMPILANSLC